MADEAKPTKATLKMVDVAKPAGGQATSRPVIVGHGAIIRDPMMAPANWDEAPETASSAPAKISVTVDAKPPKAAEASESEVSTESANTSEPADQTEEPAAADDTIEKSDAAAKTPPAEKPAVKTGLQLVGKKIQPINDMSGESDNKSNESDANSADNSIIKDPNKADTPSEDKIGAVTVERMAELKNGKEYKVSISKGHGSRTSWSAIVLIFILLAIGVLVVVDAGWLDLGINLPFDFIK